MCGDERSGVVLLQKSPTGCIQGIHSRLVALNLMGLRVYDIAPNRCDRTLFAAGQMHVGQCVL